MGKILSYRNANLRKRQGDNMCVILEKIKNKTPYELLTEYDIPLKAPIDISSLLEKIGISTIANDFTEVEKSK